MSDAPTEPKAESKDTAAEAKAGEPQGATIKKPDANPVVALLLCFIFNLGHLIVNCQQKKCMWTFILCLVTLPFAVGIVFFAFSVVDAYQTAERLQKGEEIGENEYSLPILYSIIKIIDKTATCKSAS